MKNCRFGWTNPLTLINISFFIPPSSSIIFCSHLFFFPSIFAISLCFIFLDLYVSVSWLHASLVVLIETVDLDLSRLSCLLACFWKECIMSAVSSLWIFCFIHFGSKVLFLIYTSSARRYLSEEVCKTISDLLRSPAACVRVNRVFIEWQSGSAAPLTLIALWQTERDDSQEMQKLSDTAHLTKAHPRTGDLTTSAPRLTWARDKGPPVSLGRDMSLQILSGFSIPSLPPSVLLSSARLKYASCALACELEKREPQKTGVTLH